MEHLKFLDDVLLRGSGHKPVNQQTPKEGGCIPAQTLLCSSRLANGTSPASMLARAGVCNGALAAGLRRRTYSHAESRERQTDAALFRPGNRRPAGHSAPAGWPLSRSPARRLAAHAPPRPRAPARVAPEKVIRHGPDSTCSVASIFWKKHRALRACARSALFQRRF